jgi:membrane-associated protein
MNWAAFLIDFILHIDVHLEQAIRQYGVLTYLILFVIVFCETGLVVTPFLPGDSLLFAAGALAAKDLLHPVFLPVLLAIAAILGDMTNYWVGRTFGLRGFRDNARFLNTRHVERTHAFYARHGAKTLVMARFLPIVRTFAPFVAGLGGMSFPRFIAFSMLGGILWVGSCFVAGILFGNIPVVKDHFSLVVLGIIAVSLLPTAVALLRARFAK